MVARPGLEDCYKGADGFFRWRATDELLEPDELWRVMDELLSHPHKPLTADHLDMKAIKDAADYCDELAEDNDA